MLFGAVRRLMVSTTAAMIVFMLLDVYGIIIPPLTLYQVFFTLGLALFTLILDPPKYYVFKEFGLQNGVYRLDSWLLHRNSIPNPN